MPCLVSFDSLFCGESNDTKSMKIRSDLAKKRAKMPSPLGHFEICLNFNLPSAGMAAETAAALLAIAEEMTTRKRTGGFFVLTKPQLVSDGFDQPPEWTAVFCPSGFDGWRNGNAHSLFSFKILKFFEFAFKKQRGFFAFWLGNYSINYCKWLWEDGIFNVIKSIK